MDAEHVPSESARTSQTDPEPVPSIRARTPAERLTANGLRLTAQAHGSEGGLEETKPAAPCDVPLDVWFRRLLERYPKQALSTGYLTEDAWNEIFRTDMRPAAVIWDEIQTHLENQKRGYQWRVKGMVPKLEKWLREGLWKQLHDEHPPSAVVSEKTAHTLTAAAAFIRGGADDERS